MALFKDQVAVVTGATSGIGKAIALDLASQGATLCILGRHSVVLQNVTEEIKAYTQNSKAYLLDLLQEEAIQTVATQIQHDFGRVDVLIHSAGICILGSMATSAIADFDRHYAINIRAPYLLTQLLLPTLKAHHGQIVFLNSTAGLIAKAEVGQYASTKFALKAIADSLREEVNPAGVRVLSVYLGRTATPMQAKIHQVEDQPYYPDHLIQAKDVADVVSNALSLPRNAEICDINMRPMSKPK
jgi:NADP-dependent 3-hydroxy acid dehydrogenase YdfG